MRVTRHKAVAAIGCVLVALLMACSDSPVLEGSAEPQGRPDDVGLTRIHGGSWGCRGIGQDLILWT